jgi:hypothetical protein
MSRAPFEVLETIYTGEAFDIAFELFDDDTSALFDWSGFGYVPTIVVEDENHIALASKTGADVEAPSAGIMQASFSGSITASWPEGNLIVTAWLYDAPNDFKRAIRTASLPVIKRANV